MSSPCLVTIGRRTFLTLIFVEHPLDLIRLSRLRQGQLQKDARFLWTQVIGGDETWLLPIVISNHPAGAESGAAYDDNTGRVVQLFQDFSCILSVAGTGAGDDQPLCTGSDCGLGQIAVVARVAVENSSLLKLVDLR